MSQDTSPYALALKVFHALRHDDDLPLLYDSKELAEELMCFCPSGYDWSLSEDLAEEMLPEGCYWFGFYDDEITNNAEGEDGGASFGETESDGDSGSGYPFLMLYAMRRQRLDAVQKLFDACPSLLTCMPLFDNKHRPRPYFKIPDALNEHKGENESNSLVGNCHECPHQWVSPLLDAAANSEDESILRFVLLNHPEACQVPTAVEHSTPRLNYSESDCVVCSTRASQHSASLPGVHSLRFMEEWDSEHACDNGDNSFSGESELSAEEDDDLLSVIDLCLNKDKPEILIYLLYHSIWIHLVPEKIKEIPVHGQVYRRRECVYHLCEWILHCVVLTNHSHLLHLFGCFSHQRSLDPPPGSEIKREWDEKCNQDCRDGHENGASCCRWHSADPHPSSHMIPDVNMLLPVSLQGIHKWHPTFKDFRLAPLHLACWGCNPTSIRVLLNHGANVNLVAGQLQSPTAVREEGCTLTLRNTESAHSRGISDSSQQQQTVDINYADHPIPIVQQTHTMRPLIEYNTLTPLAMLVHGIRYRPGPMFRKGKALGLMLPTLPDSEEEKNKCSDDQAKLCAMEALELLLEAGSDVNAILFIGGKKVRALDVLLQSSSQLYDNLLRDITIEDMREARCQELTLVGQLVLPVSWKLLVHGATPGPQFSSTMEWKLSYMDWAHMQDETLKKRFLHLAVFLGLFPPLDPVVVGRPNVTENGEDMRTACTGCDQSQISAVRPSSDALLSDTGEDQVTTCDINGENQEEELTRTVTPSHTVQLAQLMLQETEPYVYNPVGHTSVFAGLDRSSSGDDDFTVAHGLVNSLAHPDEGTDQRREEESIVSYSDLTKNRVMDTRGQCKRQHQHLYQRRCLEGFVEDVLKLSVSPPCQRQILHFLCLPDLHVLAGIVRDKMGDASDSENHSLQVLGGCVQQAQMRTLEHSCKLAVLWAVRWRPSLVLQLPLPECRKQDLLFPE